MTDLKTLKDMGADSFCACGLRFGEPCLVCDSTFKFKPSAKVFTEEELRTNAVEWIKEDMKDWDLMVLNPSEMILRWMHRLNITEEYLK